MADPSLATSADYADALLVARRGKKVLFLLILLMLLAQIACFFVARYTNLIVTAPATTRPTSHIAWQWITAVTTVLGTILPMLLAAVLLLIVNIMLVGRLIGVARVTSAFLWCLLLVLLLFPWQKFFGITTDPADLRLPGVVYTWEELFLYAKFSPDDPNLAIIKWARFFVFPLLAVILLLVVQIKSSRGLRQALGEAEPELNVGERLA